MASVEDGCKLENDCADALWALPLVQLLQSKCLAGPAWCPQAPFALWMKPRMVPIAVCRQFQDSSRAASSCCHSSSLRNNDFSLCFHMSVRTCAAGHVLLNIDALLDDTAKPQDHAKERAPKDTQHAIQNNRCQRSRNTKPVIDKRPRCFKFGAPGRAASE